MSGINIKKFLNSFSQNYNRQPSTSGTNSTASTNIQNTSTRVEMDTSGPKLPSQNALSHIGQNIKTVVQNFKLNVLENADRANYLKDVLNLPKNVNEFIYMVQKNLTRKELSNELAKQQLPQTQTPQTQAKTISNIESQILSQQAYLNNANTKTLTIQNLTQQTPNQQTMQNITQQGQNSQTQTSMTGGASQNNQQPLTPQQTIAQNILSGQVIDSGILNIQNKTQETINSKLLAEIYDPNATTAEETAEIVFAKELQATLKKLEINPGCMISLGKISQLIQKNGKDAITKIIMSMTEASKSGIEDLSQMKEMAKFINASISVAAENNPQKTLKLFLLLYLPWLPLEEGVNFDINIEEKSNSETQESDSILVITVTTVNYGTVRATLILETSNSVQVSIECSETFPKKELKLRIEKEQTYYSMDSVLSFTTDENIKQNEGIKQTASVNMSQTTEINPYLLLMAHALIKHIIEIDNNKTLGLATHEDKF